MEWGKLNIQTVENTLCKSVELLPETKFFANVVLHNKFLLLEYKTVAERLECMSKSRQNLKFHTKEYMTEMLILNKKLGQ